MSVHKKLQEARVKLQNTKLTKSGLNKFAGFQYFELADFLPAIQNICNEVGICGTISFTPEMATLTITDVEDSTNITFSCPNTEVSLKGCLPIQGLGAAQTYLRRYLWQNAFEIVEHDALDATAGKDELKAVKHKPTDSPYVPTPEEETFLLDIVDKIVTHGDDYSAAAEYLSSIVLDNDEKVWVWSKLDSKMRSGIKKYNEAKKQSN